MRRRDFIAGLGGIAIAASRAVAATGKTARIGWLSPGNASDTLNEKVRVAFLERLRGLGWPNDAIDFTARYPQGDPAQFAAAAKELIALDPDVIVAISGTSLAALGNEKRIAIVFTNVTDPVSQGFVASLAHPGGNITGFSYFDAAIGSKWVSLLKQLEPDLVRVVCLFNPDTAASANFFLKTLTAAGTAVGVTIEGGPVHSDSDIMRVVANAAAQSQRTGLIELPDGFFDTYGKTVIAETLRLRVPTFFFLPSQIAQGGLISYAGDQLEQVTGAASYVDRILKGEKPSDLPVQGMAKFQLAINLKTAKALGISVPQSLLVQADQVIE